MKIELELPDKPEVHAIAGILNIDPDAVVGKLLRVWQWFDKHTVDGNAFGVTCLLPDRISGVTGFGEAMMFVGWLEQNDSVLTMPKFDRHTSKSAKTRALTANRVQKKRNADVTLQALPREEKRRDISTSLRSVEKQLATRLPKDWNPSSEEIKFCKTERPDLDVAVVVEKFRDYWIGAAGAKGRKQDWSATWRNWVRNESKQAQARASPPAKTAVERRIEIADAMFGDLVNGRRRERGISQDGTERDRSPVLVIGDDLR